MKLSKRALPVDSLSTEVRCFSLVTNIHRGPAQGHLVTKCTGGSHNFSKRKRERNAHHLTRANVAINPNISKERPQLQLSVQGVSIYNYDPRVAEHTYARRPEISHSLLTRQTSAVQLS